jgi:hypothetical protein
MAHTQSAPSRGGRGRRIAGSQSRPRICVGTQEEDDTDFLADRGYYISDNSTRRNEELLDIPHKKRRVDRHELDDPLASWDPMPTGDGEDLNDMENDTGPTLLGKRKNYESSVCFVMHSNTNS